MKLHVAITTAVCGLTFFPALAFAQDQADWLKDRKYTEGIGYRVGDFELHPGLGAEFGYDSNFFHRSQQDFGGDVGALRLKVTPSFSFSTLGQQRREANGAGSPPDVEFRGGLSATYNDFFPVSGPQSGQDEMKHERNVGVGADLQLTILPSRPWSGNLYAGFTRSITPTQEGIVGTNFNRDNPRAGGELIWTPGGGLLDWRVGYGFTGTFFETGAFSALDNFDHDITMRGRWRFLPRTALFFDGKQSFINYEGGSFKTSSHPLRAQLGVTGLITPSFGMLVEAGWGASFYTPTGQQDFDSVIGKAELKWYITPNPSQDPAAATLALSSVAVGFARDFHDSYIGSFYETDRGYATLSYFFGGAFLVVLDGGVGPVRYPDMNTIPGLVQMPFDNHAAFTDIKADATLFGEYRIKDEFGINATFRYGGNFSSAPPLTFSTSGLGATPGTVQHLDWQEFEAYIGARWFM